VSFALAPAAGRRAAPRARIPCEPNAAARGLEVSLRHVAQNLLLQGKFSHQPFQPGILLLQLLQLAGLIDFQPSLLLLPAIESLLRNPRFTNQLHYGNSYLRLLRNRHNLLH